MKPTRKLFEDVTAIIPTRGRYNTTLPLTLLSVLEQECAPASVVIYDDNVQHVDMRSIHACRCILESFDRVGIRWKVVFGGGNGQVRAHNFSISDSKTTYVWRIDDDCVAMPDVLKILHAYAECDPSVGAVGGRVCLPWPPKKMPSFLNGSIDDALLGFNVQWFDADSCMRVDHLYSSFLFRRAAASHGYDERLSPIGHREETMFTFGMKKAGFDLLFAPDALTLHYHNSDGGVRSFDGVRDTYYENDNGIFASFLNENGIANRPLFVVLNGGIGDHYAFKSAMLGAQYVPKQRIIIACCYPDVFYDCGVETISIAEAIGAFGHGVVSMADVYKYMAGRHWTSSVSAAFEKIYFNK